MLSAITRHCVVPLHERVLHRPTLRCARELDWSQWLAPSSIRDLQRRKLGELLHHAGNETPFYRLRLESVGADWRSRDPFDVLRDLETLSKTDIRHALEEMLWRASPGGLHRSNTGGSTGEPLTFFVDRRRQAYDQAARIRTHRWFGANLGEPELYLWGSPIEQSRTSGLRRVRDALFNHRLLDAFNMSPAKMDAYLDVWNRYRPVSLFGYPSSIALLVDHARARNRKLDLRRLKAVFVTGEVCYPHLRETIGEFFQVPVADGYGSRDAGFVAHQCPQGNMHITAENVIVEIMDRHQQPLPEEQGGEIVITHLDAWGMPLIRYRTGDVGRLKKGRCSCGRGLPMLDVVQGRATDFLYLPDGTVKHALSIIYPLRAMEGLRQFRVTQDKDYGVCVEVVADDRSFRITQDAVEKRVRPVIGGEIRLRVELVEELSPTPSGKHRYVVSHVGLRHGEVSEEAHG